MAFDAQPEGRESVAGEAHAPELTVHKTEHEEAAQLVASEIGLPVRDLGEGGPVLGGAWDAAIRQ